MTATDERTRWEERYREGRGPGSDTPSAFLLQAMPRLPRGRALDVAAGTGRNALALARNGFRVDAIDLAHTGLRRARAVARKEGLELRCLQADLDSFPLPRARYDVVVHTRFLQRALWPALAAALQPGGHLVFETFLLEQRTLGHPRNPAFLLEPAELRTAFPNLETLTYEEGCFETELGPAYLARLLARR